MKQWPSLPSPSIRRTTGVVDTIDVERGKVRLLVNFFGRETPVELDFLQVEKV